MAASFGLNTYYPHLSEHLTFLRLTRTHAHTCTNIQRAFPVITDLGIDKMLLVERYTSNQTRGLLNAQ